MESEYKIIDNALNTNDFDILNDFILGDKISWYFQQAVAYSSDTLKLYKDEENLRLVDKPLTEGQKNWNFYWTHTIFAKSMLMSSPDFWNAIQPILGILKPKSLIRAKVNFYPRTDDIVYHKKHTDLPFEHTGALFYLNTNDGLTVLEDGTKIESIENRILLFDASRPHHSTTTSDQTRRMNINFNYL